MRRLLLPLLCTASICLFGGVAAAKDEPGSLKALSERLAALDKQITALLAESKKDPDEWKIREYKGYTAKQLEKTRGRVRARDLIEFMVDTSKNYNIRRMAMEAIHEGGIRNDPELSTQEKQGPRTKRAHFCKTQVVKLLKADDRSTRGLADELLKKFWVVNRRNHPEIMDYKADKEDTWKAAIRGWDDYLRKS